jgi:hypothetical protein
MPISWMHRIFRQPPNPRAIAKRTGACHLRRAILAVVVLPGNPARTRRGTRCRKHTSQREDHFTVAMSRAVCENYPTGEVRIKSNYRFTCGHAKRLLPRTSTPVPHLAACENEKAILFTLRPRVDGKTVRNKNVKKGRAW